MSTQYRSVFSGLQIDQAIAKLQSSVSVTDIANDFNGGVTRVASAEIAKTLYNTINTAITPANIKAVLLSIPNSNIYTDAEKAKLLSMTSSIMGSFKTVSDRTLNLNPISYSGTELSFVVDDGNNRGLSQLSRWDITKNKWVIARLYNVDEFTPVVVATASVFSLYSFDITKFSLIKVLISCVDSTGANRQIQEVLLSYVGSNTYISVYGEVGNTSTLFNLTSSMTGNIVTLSATTSVANSVISYKMTDMI
jgi:hypothetical protein